MRTLTSSALLAAVASTASVSIAQEAILPARSYYTHTGNSTATWRNTAFRFQMIYDTTNFTDQGIVGPISITRLRFRANNGVVYAGGAAYSVANVQLSSSTLDYASTVTTFATNRGADNQLCYSGPVTAGAAAGTTPNTNIIDITLTTPFTYDPSLGADLIVEVDAPLPSPATMPSMATTNVITQRARRISAATQAATTGATSTFASELLIDFTGPGGYSTWTSAGNTREGIGCYTVARSFYELFPGVTPLSSNDLSNTTVSMAQNANGGYTVTTTPGSTVVPPTAAGLALGDDAESPAQVLPFTFDYPGGTTTSIVVGSNGYVNLNGPTSGSFVLGGQAYSNELLTRIVTTGSAPRHILAPSLQDFEPDGAVNTNNVFANVDPTNPSVFLITWSNVNCWHTVTQANPVRSTFQVALIDNGTNDSVEFRYATLANDSTNGFGPDGEAITGFSLGQGSIDPGNSDLTAGPISTAVPEQPGLALSSTMPFLGAALTHTVSNIPPAALISARLLGFGAVPGVDLGGLGAPGCKQWIDTATAATDVLFGSPSASVTLTIPNNSAFLGVVVIAQGASLVPGVNALGLLTTNGNTLTVGNTD